MQQLRIAFAGDRDISVWVLKYILERDVRPLALLVSAGPGASHADQLLPLCSFLEPNLVLRGRQFREPAGLALLERLDLDYIVCVHFPYILPEEVLCIPRVGVLNLHPAYLPYNRGWHTPSWAILEETPAGATLHFMDEGTDTGDIVHQNTLEVSPADTAHCLYQRLKELELEVFKEAWPRLVSGTYDRIPQNPNEGTAHTRAQLFADHIQRIDLTARVGAGDLLRRLRALTTDRVDEAAYYEAEGKRYRIQVVVHEQTEGS